MRIFKYILAIGVVTAVIAGGMSLQAARQQRTTEGATKTESDKKAAQERAANQRMETLRKELTAIIDNAPVSTSVSVIDLSNDKHAHAGLDVVFRAASTTKVLSVAAYMQKVEQGSANLDTLVGGTRAELLLERMLRNSDNTAWAAINRFIGAKNLAAYAQSIGITSYTSSNNAIDSNDMALLFQKLYNGQLMDASHTKLILSFMQDTNNEDLIPAALPDGATVHHKFGLYEGELHDAAIVSHQGHTFVLVIFTNNEQGVMGSYDERTGLIHRLTTATVRTLAGSAASQR